MNGQSEGERAALPGLALYPDTSSVIFDDFLADRQAQACAFGLVGEGVADLFELLKDFWLIGGCDANAGVRDADD